MAFINKYSQCPMTINNIICMINVVVLKMKLINNFKLAKLIYLWLGTLKLLIAQGLFSIWDKYKFKLHTLVTIFSVQLLLFAHKLSIRQVSE